ncbi:MAG TPA: GNAT family protein [Solirubrobacteraceae bacterium]
MTLEPLAPAHEAGLWEASRPPEIWTWLQAQPDRAGFRAILDEARAATARREEFAFATVHAASGQPVGMTRYMALRPADRALEIGWTWLTPALWRTGANVEAKLLQMQYAFETLGCLRVELKTHASNARSRGAMERLGATFEGVHRKHRILPGIGVRDTAWYSVVDDEWPQVRDGLRARLARLGSESAGSAK